MRRNKPSRHSHGYKRSHQLVIRPFGNAEQRNQGALPAGEFEPL
jgi:hypothetical protein